MDPNKKVCIIEAGGVEDATEEAITLLNCVDGSRNQVGSTAKSM